MEEQGPKGGREVEGSSAEFGNLFAAVCGQYLLYGVGIGSTVF